MVRASFLSLPVLTNLHTLLPIFLSFLLGQYDEIPGGIEFTEKEGRLIYSVFPASRDAGGSIMPKISAARIAFAKASNRQFKLLHVALREKHPRGDLQREYLAEAVRRWRENKTSDEDSD